MTYTDPRHLDNLLGSYGSRLEVDEIAERAASTHDGGDALDVAVGEDEGAGRLETRFAAGRHQPVFLLSPAQAQRKAKAIADRDSRKAVRRGNRKGLAEYKRAMTLRQMLAVLTGKVQATPAAKANLERAMQAEEKRNNASIFAEDRKFHRQQAGIARLNERRAARFAAGKPRGKDLRDGVFEEYAHLLPEGYAGKRAS